MTRIDPGAVFEVEKPVVGMVHLLPLPGAPGWGGSVDAVLERALSDARSLEEGGIDGLLVENFGDAPFLPDRVPPETVAALARVTAEVVRDGSLPVGVNVLRNDARSALAVAAATGARFIRVNVHAGTMVTDQGPLDGRAHETLRVRRALGSDVAVLADVHVKHAVPPPGQTVEQAAGDLWERAGADALVASGDGTGHPTDPGAVQRIRSAVPGAPLWIGSGVTADSVRTLLPLCDGLLVGSALQKGGRAGAGVEDDRVARFMDAVQSARAAPGG